MSENTKKKLTLLIRSLVYLLFFRSLLTDDNELKYFVLDGELISKRLAIQNIAIFVQHTYFLSKFRKKGCVVTTIPIFYFGNWETQFSKAGFEFV